MKKISSIFLGLMLTLALLPAGIFAADAENVAKIGDVEYATLQTAVDNATDGAVIELLRDVKVKSSIKIESGKNVIINLNGKTIQNNSQYNVDIISNYGTLELKDTSTNGAVKNTGNGSAITNYSDGTVIIRGGKYTASGWYTIKNMGKMTIYDGEFNGYDGSSLIANGWYGNAANDRNTTGEAGKAILTINGGDFNEGMNCVKNDDYGVATINGGTFSKSGLNSVIQNWHKMTINDGDFTNTSTETQITDADGNYIGGQVIANGSYGKNSADAGELTINGGEFESALDGKAPLFGAGGGTKNNESQTNIKGGDYEGVIRDVNGVVPVVSGGTFYNKVDSKYIDKNATELHLLYSSLNGSGSEGLYFVGTADEVNKAAQEAIKGIEGVDNVKLTLDVITGNVALTDIKDGVNVKNSGNGKVSVNNVAVNPGKTVVAKSIEKVNTADDTSMAIALVLAIIGLCGTAAVARKKKYNN